jgi:mannose-6-phosphate isomerase-like protein (cupin superfamily)
MPEREAGPPKPVNLRQALASFDESYSPRIAAHVNEYDVKLGHARGEHVWHVHQETDELFLVVDGRLTIALRDADGVESAVELGAWDVYVVPRGLEHKPDAERASFMLLEPSGTRSTGDYQGAIPANVDSTTGHRLD